MSEFCLVCSFIGKIIWLFVSLISDVNNRFEMVLSLFLLPDHGFIDYRCRKIAGSRVVFTIRDRLNFHFSLDAKTFSGRENVSFNSRNFE